MMGDMERLRFGGKMHRVIEEDLQASFSGMSQAAFDVLEDDLYKKYEAAGKPRNLRKWLQAYLEPLFISVAERPRWVGNVPMWAYHEDKPMVFIRQFPVGSGPIEDTKIAPNVMLYVFGIRVSTEHGGWRMEYKVIEDDPKTKGLTIKVTPEDLA